MSNALKVIPGGRINKSKGLVTNFGNLMVYLPLNSSNSSNRGNNMKPVRKAGPPALSEEDAWQPTDRPYTYGTTQITIDPTSDLYKVVKGIQLMIPDSEEGGKSGANIDPHITIRYGLTEQTGAPEHILKIEPYLAEFPQFTVRIGEITSLPATESSDNAIPIVALVESDELDTLHDEFANLADFTDEVSFDPYIPHLTIAYLNPGSDWVDRLVGTRLLDGFTYDVKQIDVVWVDGRKLSADVGTGRKGGVLNENTANVPAMMIDENSTSKPLIAFAKNLLASRGHL